MTIGIIGLGSMGERHALNIQEMYPHASITILTKRTSWEQKSSRTKLIAVEKDFYAIKHDVYFITNESGKHAATILDCLAQKPLGIFVEKPLSHTTISLEQIRSVAESENIILVIGYSLQFFKPLIELRKIVRAGTLGDIISMRVSVGKDVSTWRTLDYATRYSSKASEGGGAILDFIHELNYPGWILGEEIHFLCGVQGTTRLPIDAEDIAESLFRSTSGVLISIHQDYMQVPGKRFCEVIGTKGTATFSRVLRRGQEANEIRIDTDKKTTLRIIQTEGNDMYRGEIKSFMKHVQAQDGYTNLTEAIQDVYNAEKLKKESIQLTTLQ